MKTVVIKLSGSLFSFDKDYSHVKKITKTLDEISRSGYKVVAVAGGGKTARNMQNAARNFHADEAFLDQLGIDVSRIHAKILTTCTTNSCQDVPKTLDEVVRCLTSSKIVFTGGLSPGQSTNATAALIAERTKAKLFVNAIVLAPFVTTLFGIFKPETESVVVPAANALTLLPPITTKCNSPK